MAFQRRPLRAAAEACLEFGQKWAQLGPASLAAEVQAVLRIGPWTAGASVADFTNDYSLYPFADLAVRTWAKRLASDGYALTATGTPRNGISTTSKSPATHAEREQPAGVQPRTEAAQVTAREQ